MLNDTGRARWSLWIVQNLRRETRSRSQPGMVSRVRAQPDSPSSLELAPKQQGVHALAFVAKPEQLPECTSHLARMGYDKRRS